MDNKQIQYVHMLDAHLKKEGNSDRSYTKMSPKGTMLGKTGLAGGERGVESCLVSSAARQRVLRRRTVVTATPQHECA
jgi:hypothetical protein